MILSLVITFCPPFLDTPTKLFSKVPLSTHMYFSTTLDFEPPTLFMGIMVYMILKLNLAKKHPPTPICVLKYMDSTDTKIYLNIDEH